MNENETVTISIKGLPSREDLLLAARSVGQQDAAEILRRIAEAMPTPWPTTPGSTGQCRDGHWFGIDAEGTWRRFMTGAPCPPDFLRQMGFTPRHDEGADQ